MLIDDVEKAYNDFWELNKYTPKVIYLDRNTKYNLFKEYYAQNNGKYIADDISYADLKFMGMSITLLDIYNNINIPFFRFTYKCDNLAQYTKENIIRGIYIARINFFDLTGEYPTTLYVNRYVSLMLIKELQLLNDPKYKRTKMEFMDLIVKDIIIYNNNDIPFLMLNNRKEDNVTYKI